jgi:DNA polymerase-3 subunit epsilon
MKAIAYIDVETTGLDPKKHALREVAVIIEIDGKIKEKQLFKINPFLYNKKVEVDADALKISGLTIEDLEEDSYQHPIIQIVRFVDLLEKYSFNKQEEKVHRYQIIGYNIAFDIGFLKEWFYDTDLYHFSNIFDHKSICVFELVKHLKYMGVIKTHNDKLPTLCEKYNIPLNAHNALDDIEATKELYELLQRYIKRSL